MSSELRLKTAIVPSASLWTWEKRHTYDWMPHSDLYENNRTHLSPFAIVLVLARELLPFKFVEHLSDCLCWLGQHWLQWHARTKLAFLPQLVDANVEKRGYDEVVARKLATLVDDQTRCHRHPKPRTVDSPIHLLDDACSILEPRGKLLFALPLVSYTMQLIRISRRSDYPEHSQLSCSASTAACASATRTVRSALPIRSLPSKLRTMYFAS